MKKSLKIQKEIDDKSGMAYSLNNIGKIYKKQGNLPKALEYLNKSLKKRKENGDKKGVAYSLNNIGALYIKIAESSATSGSKKKNYLFALSYSDSSLAISKELGFPENIRNAEGTLSKIDSARGNYLGAFEHYKQYIIFRDSLNNKETHKASMKNQIKYEYDKKSVADSVRVQEEKKVISQ